MSGFLIGLGIGVLAVAIPVGIYVKRFFDAWDEGWGYK